jgi:cell division septum initiation protein DivIVA
MNDTSQNQLAAKRLGEYLIEAGVLTPEQLQEALERQKRMGRAGFHVLLGTILEEMGVLDRQRLEAVILQQRLDEGSISPGSEEEWAAFRAAIQERARKPTTTPSSVTDGYIAAPDKTAPQEQPQGERQPSALEGRESAGITATSQWEANQTGWESPPSATAQDTPAAHRVGAMERENPPTASFSPQPSSLLGQGESQQSQETSIPPRYTSPPPAAPHLAPSTIQVHGFTFTRLSSGGLPEHEVASVIAQLAQRAKTLEDQLRELQQRTEHLDSLTKLAEQTVKAADAIAEQIRDEAEKQAALTREHAQQEAVRIITEAKARHDQIIRHSVERAHQFTTEIRKSIEQQQWEFSARLQELIERILKSDVAVEAHTAPSTAESESH